MKRRNEQTLEPVWGVPVKLIKINVEFSYLKWEQNIKNIFFTTLLCVSHCVEYLVILW